MATGGDNLWIECAKWLSSFGVIPEDHKACSSDAEVWVLALALRDGVILCLLLEAIDPNVDINSYNRKPQLAQFLCFHNLNIFLETCRNYFGLKESDLFEPTMLYDLTDFQRVLFTLSKLSQCRRVLDLHPDRKGFGLEMEPEDDDIYKELHLSTNNSLLGHDHDEQRAKEEEVYQDLCSIQNLTRTTLTSHTVSFEQRDFVIRELLDTETNYLEVLNALRNKFMQPLEKLLSKEELKIIFYRIKDIYEVHSKFLERLREATAPNTRYKLSQVFLDFRERFLIYGEYCSNMTPATDMLREISKRNSSVEQAVMQCQKEHSGGRVQLRDILTVPMQRILKYHLLLDKLVHETSATHEDYRGLERAKEAMIDVAQYTNEVKRDSEHLTVINKVKESILDWNLPAGNNLQQYGHLLLDGDLNIKAHEDQKIKHRYAFIFEKLMILVKSVSSKVDDMQYSFREAHNLIEYRIENCALGRRRDPRFKYQFLLARKTQSMAFTLYMKTDSERNKWMKAFQEAFDNLEPPGCRNTDHKFQLTTFEKAIPCWHCSKFLKGLIHQGYRCSVCDIGVHKGCISSTGRCRLSLSLPPPVCDRVLSEFYWFVGTMDRDTATAKLSSRKVGTYLLRVRPQGASHPEETMYALSLKTDENVVKHMKIFKEVENGATLYLLSKHRRFNKIVELVSYYERNDLGENFAGLNQTLQWPFKEVLATALFDFVPTESSQLPLKRGCMVVVIGKEGDSKGWWRGKTNDRVGFFPKEYVKVHKLGNEIS